MWQLLLSPFLCLVDGLKWELCTINKGVQCREEQCTGHVEGGVDVDVVGLNELVPPIHEWGAYFVVHGGPLQGHELGIPYHLQLDDILVLVAVCYLEVH
jgi:hypothetical protein